MAKAIPAGGLQRFKFAAKALRPSNAAFLPFSSAFYQPPPPQRHYHLFLAAK
jgi:hypothetical protein